MTAILNPAKVRVALELPSGRNMLVCRYQPGGRHLAAGGMNEQVTQWDTSGKVPGPALHLNGHRNWVGALAFSPAGDRLYSADHSGVLLCRRFPAKAASEEPLWKVDAHRSWCRTLAVSPDGLLIATAGNDRLVRLWSADGRPLETLQGHDCDVYNVGFHPKGGRLVSADLKGVVKDWDVTRGKLVRDLDAAPLFCQQGHLRLGGVRSLAFDRDGSRLACGGMSSIGSIGDGTGKATVVLFDWASGKRLPLLLPDEDVASFVTGLAFHPGGHLVACTGGFARGVLLFWKGDGPKSLPRVKMAESGWGLDLHPEGRFLAVAHHGGRIGIHDLLP